MALALCTALAAPCARAGTAGGQDDRRGGRQCVRWLDGACAGGTAAAGAGGWSTGEV